MGFASLEYGFFFLLIVSLYWLLPHRGQNRMLLAASYVFYATWDWRFLSLLIFSTIVDYSIGRRLSVTTDATARRLLALLSLATNLGILALFKYSGFFGESLQELVALFGVELSSFTIDVILPVGISFYTFQTLSYTLDVYRGRLDATRDFFDFALFVAFFPQLVAGPIERARRLLPQIAHKRRASWEKFNSGVWLVLWGIYKKVVIADNIAVIVDAVYRPGSDPTSGEIVVATYAFAWQIYCDFSGYTDVARGTARLLGFDLMLNFKVPYAAKNPAEFWRRWHISLSTWLRDYVYISLGGNRRGDWLTHRNLLMTMVIGGLWHGAAWPFVLWGAYHGLLLMGHRLLQPRLATILPSGVLVRWLSCLLLFHAVALGWLFFRAESLEQIGALLIVLTGPFDIGLAANWIRPFCTLLAPLVVYEILQESTRDLDVIVRVPTILRATSYAALAIVILVLGEQIGQPFIYFQF